MSIRACNAPEELRPRTLGFLAALYQGPVMRQPCHFSTFITHRDSNDTLRQGYVAPSCRSFFHRYLDHGTWLRRDIANSRLPTMITLQISWLSVSVPFSCSSPSDSKILSIACLAEGWFDQTPLLCQVFAFNHVHNNGRKCACLALWFTKRSRPLCIR